MIPDFQTLMRPALEILADGQVHRNREILQALSERFELTSEQRNELLPSGKQRTMDNRVGWTLTYLAQAGLAERPRRGHYRITDEGQRALAANPVRIDMSVLEQYPKYIAFKERTRTPESQGAEDSRARVEELEADAATPAELIDKAVRANRAVVEGEILERALGLDPTGFEDLVIQLLGAMGYGRSGSLERTSASGDAGVDGIISQDPLGLDRIYLQAKRYAVDRPIDRPKIHEFAGALLGKQGDRGVFITTSSFTRGARDEAERIHARIELIDGQRLAKLLVAYEVGVQEASVAKLYRLDDDFFEAF